MSTNSSSSSSSSSSNKGGAGNQVADGHCLGIGLAAAAAAAAVNMAPAEESAKRRAVSSCCRSRVKTCSSTSTSSHISSRYKGEAGAEIKVGNV